MNDNSRNIKDTIVSGLALFAIFFGAGNLILPPYMGLNAGQNWIWAWIGFSLSGPGLTFLGMVAMAQNQGDTNLFAGKVGHIFSILLGSVIILCIGPLMSVPRTAATTFEVSILPFLPNFSRAIFSVIFFGITLFFTINESKAIDVIGTYMTPVLLIILFFIILKGIFTPISPTSIAGKNQFSMGFLEGYHTMDSLSPMVLAGIIISNFRDKGIKSKEDLTQHTIYAETIAATGLILIYGGLTYLGAKSFNMVSPNLGRAELLNAIVYHFLGSAGNMALGLAVALACLTTSIGLTAAIGSFFSDVTNNRIKYKYIVIASVLVSALLSIIGVEAILKLSLPILVSVYPVVIVLTILNLFDKFIKSDLVYKVTIYFTLFASIIVGIEEAGLSNFPLVKLFSKLPLWESGFSWIIISFVGLILSLVLSELSVKDEDPLNEMKKL